MTRTSSVHIGIIELVDYIGSDGLDMAICDSLWENLAYGIFVKI